MKPHWTEGFWLGTYRSRRGRRAFRRNPPRLLNERSAFRGEEAVGRCAAGIPGHARRLCKAGANRFTNGTQRSVMANQEALRCLDNADR